MSEKEKKRFQEMADRDKKRYEMEMQDYVPAKGEKGRGKKRKHTKDPNAPKRSLSAFFWFCNDERPKVNYQQSSCIVSVQNNLFVLGQGNES